MLEEIPPPRAKHDQDHHISAELTGSLGSKALPGIQQLHGLSLKLGSEPSSLSHVAPPLGRIVPPFEVSVKPGPAHATSSRVFFDLT